MGFSQEMSETKTAVAHRIRASRVLAVPGISHTDAEKGEIFARCAAETANLWRHR